MKQNFFVMSVFQQYIDSVALKNNQVKIQLIAKTRRIDRRSIDPADAVCSSHSNIGPKSNLNDRHTTSSTDMTYTGGNGFTWCFLLRILFFSAGFFVQIGAENCVKQRTHGRTRG